jgi:hypothetical protein
MVSSRRASIAVNIAATLIWRPHHQKHSACQLLSLTDLMSGIAATIQGHSPLDVNIKRTDMELT